MKAMKILLLEYHLSTGGAPMFALKRIQSLLAYSEIEVYCIELNFHGSAYVVQRNQIVDLLGDRFYEAGENKMRVMDIINQIKPDIVHIEDVAERLPKELAKALYSNNRTYRIVETPHDNIFNPDADKAFHPDLYAFCTPFHEDVYANMDSKYFTIQYPIEEKEATSDVKLEAKKKVGFSLDRKTALHIGLWTPQKNQKETIAIAREFPDIDFVVAGNMAGNFQFYWEDLIKDLPTNFKALGERSDIDTLLQAADIFIFPSTNECSPLSIRHAIEVGLPIVANNLPAYAGTLDKYIKPLDSDLYTITRDYNIPNNNNSINFALDHVKMYEEIVKFPIIKKSVRILQHFINHPFLEIKGESDSEFDVRFYDENDVCHYQNTIKSNSWVRLNRQYYTRWKTYVYQDGELIYENVLDLHGKKVFIAFESKSLGDTLAWAPYALEFQKLHQCKVVFSTFWNKILDYPELELVEPGSSVNCYAMYKIGWHYDTNREPELPNTIPLQKAATNILGLKYTEIRPKLFTKRDCPEYNKYITIATNSTAGCKFWVREEWQKLINHYTEQGYKVYNVSKEVNPFDNCPQIPNTSIESTMDWIYHSKFFVGLSSGLSWLAWSLGKQVGLISNFTEFDHEFLTNCIRITNNKVCHGCWNKPDVVFDKGDWNWCPEHKGTDRQWECHKAISSESVIKAIKIKNI
jgi:autotransporter strand-loop-strand O-heptosyltransferase